MSTQFHFVLQGVTRGIKPPPREAELPLKLCIFFKNDKNEKNKSGVFYLFSFFLLLLLNIDY